MQRVPAALVETRADCRVSCELQTLLGLVTGSLKPVAALATGKLRVTGDRAAFRAIGACGAYWLREGSGGMA